MLPLPYLGGVGAGVGDARGVVAEGRQTGQDEVDSPDLQGHASEQDAVVCGERRGAEQRPEHVEG